MLGTVVLVASQAQAGGRGLVQPQGICDTLLYVNVCITQNKTKEDLVHNS